MKSSSHAQFPGQSVECATAKTSGSFAVREQQSLFQSAADLHSGCMDDSGLVRKVLIESIRKCGKSRTQIAEEISFLAGRKITEISLNKYTAESRSDYRWPAELDRAFCHATGDNALLRCRAELSGYRLIQANEIELLELGREYLRQKRANERVQLLEKRLSGVEI
jgi:hypothetical protein